jgi:GTP pyrophosphokinase
MAHVSADEIIVVRNAYEIALQAHEGQKRDEGTPYIVHPLRVAISLVDELSIVSVDLICAALLHDVIEDSDITRQQIAELFGERVATVVWLLTKLEETPLEDYLAAIEEAADTGAPLVKLCDRLDNLRFLIRSPKRDKIRRSIVTTERLYLPFAARTNSYLHEQLRNALEAAAEHLASMHAS